MIRTQGTNWGNGAEVLNENAERKAECTGGIAGCGRYAHARRDHYYCSGCFRFCRGLSGTQQKAPTAVLDVHIHALENQGGMPGYGTGFYVPTMTITEVSGDALATKDLKITTTYTNSSETMFAGNLSGEAAVTGESGWNAFGTSQQSGVLVFNDVDRFGYYIVPGYEGSQSGWFGNASAILRPGDILTTAAGSCGNYNDNTAPPHHMTIPEWIIFLDLT